jgi:ADP-ribosylglycohydrolase
MWQSLPTCCGQMTLLPVAALFAGEPERAYLAAWRLAFFDNGFGKDLNAALVAGLAVALTTPVDAKNPRAAWQTILSAMRATDPLRFGKIRWSERQVDRWLNLALKFARDAQGQPARLFESLEQEFKHTTKWEAQVPFVVAFACLEIADYDPLAALQLSLEWGHDTDSYAAVVGSFVGALHGPQLFPEAWRDAVVERLKADHDIALDEEARFLNRLRERSRQLELVK